MSHLKLIYRGKTKDVYENEDGTYTLKLKDDATGKDGVFDPGENAVGLSIEGLGRESLKLTKYYFEKIIDQNIPTHYIHSDIEKITMNVKPAKKFGEGLEFICRRKAVGSFIKRYGQYISEGSDLDYFVEVTLKDDQRLDPPITKDALAMLDIMSNEEYEICKKLTQEITKIIHNDLSAKGLTLYDVKFEFGKDENNKIMLIDEISGGCMRVFKDNKQIQPMDLTKLILEA